MEEIKRKKEKKVMDQINKHKHVFYRLTKGQTMPKIPDDLIDTEAAKTLIRNLTVNSKFKSNKSKPAGLE